MEVEYDMEKEKRNLKKKTDKILKNFPNVNGLEDILNINLSQYDSDSFNNLTKNLVKYIKEFGKMDMWDEFDTEEILNGNIDSIDEEFHFLKYSIILKDPKIGIFLPWLWDDAIVLADFVNFVTFNSGFLIMKKIGDLSYLKLYRFTNRMMSLGHDFDQFTLFKSVDKEFFENLKALRWNNNANKLFKKIDSIQSSIVSLIITELFSDIIGTVYSCYHSTLTMLCACSAVNRGSDIMEYEDVIRAFKTFYKLVDADINDLV